MKRLIGVLALALLLTACQPAQPMPTSTTEPTAPTAAPQLSPLATAIPGADALSPLAPATAVAPTPGPTPTRAAGTGTIEGTLIGAPTDWTGQEVRIYAAPFTPAADGKSGFFVLEPTIHPSAIVQADGAFSIPNAAPGFYVIVAGPTPETARAVLEVDQPRVFEVKADEALELGEISLQ